MSDKPRLILLSDAVSQDAVAQVLEEQGWTRASEEDGEAAIVRMWVRDAVTIADVEDRLVLARYLSATTPEAERALTEVSGRLPVVSVPELMARLNRPANREQQARDVVLLGLAAPPDFDPDIFTGVGALLMSGDSVVQSAAVMATTYLSWPEFIEPLMTLSRVVPDPNIATRARLAAITLGGDVD